MAGCDCGEGGDCKAEGAYRNALLWAFWINALFFLVETLGALRSGSTSLLADAMDFFGDSVNYGASLLVVGMASVWSSRLALAKGTIMLAWGVFVMGKAAWMLGTGGVPESDTMTVLAILALAANVSVAFLLFRHREGDANRKAVWLCARNDAFGNIAVLVAAQGVAFTGRAWPDIVAATVLASLSLTSGLAVVRRARAELRSNG